MIGAATDVPFHRVVGRPAAGGELGDRDAAVRAVRDSAVGARGSEREDRSLLGQGWLDYEHPDRRRPNAVSIHPPGRVAAPLLT